MTHRPNRPCYSNAPIRDCTKLAEVLELSLPQLIALAANANQLYLSKPQKKKDGSLRETWDAQPQLKSVQELIKVRILARTRYPLYLQGGIRDPDFPRDYARNAALHVGATLLINEDIQDFFPSTSADIVYDVWRNFFRFPDDVSLCLTQLTTKDSALPQGAKTSSYLANLAFWRDEHELVSYFERKGCVYSRLVDDITISSSNRLSSSEMSSIIAIIYRFLRRHGYHAKRGKHSISSSGRSMRVNGLLVNRKVSLTIPERSRIRSQVQHAKNNARVSTNFGNRTFRSAMGKAAQLKRFHREQGDRLLDDLRLLRHKAK